jgi:glutathione S-transferase
VAVRLFEHPLSPYARKVKIALYEKGIPFERIEVDLGFEARDEVFQDFVMTSPRREVPALIDGEVRLSDSTVILEYLDERWPQPQLLPNSAQERARVRMLEEMMDTEYEAVNWGIAEIRLFGRAEGARAEQLLTRASLQLQRLWNRLERELEGLAWMNGERFGRGDAAVYPHLRTSEVLGFPVSDQHPRVNHWLAACAERPSIGQETAEAEQAYSEISGSPTRAGSPVPRQYRDYRLEWMMKTGGVAIVLDGIEAGSIRFAGEYE